LDNEFYTPCITNTNEFNSVLVELFFVTCTKILHEIISLQENSAILKFICKTIIYLMTFKIDVNFILMIIINKLQHQIIFIKISLNIINHIYHIWTILTMHFIVKKCVSINRQKNVIILKFICKSFMINDIQNWCQLHSVEY
jgi:hypothetical protein